MFKFSLPVLELANNGLQRLYLPFLTNKNNEIIHLIIISDYLLVSANYSLILVNLLYRGSCISLAVKGVPIRLGLKEVGSPEWNVLLQPEYSETGRLRPRWQPAHTSRYTSVVLRSSDGIGRLTFKWGKRLRNIFYKNNKKK